MNFTIESLIRPNVKSLKPYSSARDEFEGEASIYLDANESPYPTEYNRYPDPHQKVIKKKISSLKKVDENQIFLGNGSDEAIDLIIRAFCEPGIDEVIIPQPTYGMYAVSAQINNVKINSASLTNEFDLDLEAIFSKVTHNTKLAFICSPNNPTGNLLSANKVESLIERFHGLVVLDEAYIDFTASESFTSKLSRYKNLVVLQTLSKAWGLASLRLGMCFASAEIISVLNKIKPPYNISGITQSQVEKHLAAIEIKNNHVQEIKSQKKWLTNELSKLKIVKQVYPSEANFILVKFNEAKRIYNFLLTKGIVTRDRSNVLMCEGCLRISIGSPSENKILIEQLSSL